MTEEPIVVHPKLHDGKFKVVVLDKVETEDPIYTVRGKVTCYTCNDWCWLGNATYELVSSGEAAGMCRQCSAQHIEAGAMKIGHADDD